MEYIRLLAHQPHTTVTLIFLVRSAGVLICLTFIAVSARILQEYGCMAKERVYYAFAMCPLLSIAALSVSNFYLQNLAAGCVLLAGIRLRRNAKFSFGLTLLAIATQILSANYATATCSAVFLLLCTSRARSSLWGSSYSAAVAVLLLVFGARIVFSTASSSNANPFAFIESFALIFWPSSLFWLLLSIQGFLRSSNPVALGEEPLSFVGLMILATAVDGTKNLPPIAAPLLVLLAAFDWTDLRRIPRLSKARLIIVVICVAALSALDQSAWLELFIEPSVVPVVSSLAFEVIVTFGSIAVLLVATGRRPESLLTWGLVTATVCFLLRIFITPQISLASLCASFSSNHPRAYVFAPKRERIGECLNLVPLGSIAAVSLKLRVASDAVVIIPRSELASLESVALPEAPPHAIDDANLTYVPVSARNQGNLEDRDSLRSSVYYTATSPREAVNVRFGNAIRLFGFDPPVPGSSDLRWCFHFSVENGTDENLNMFVHYVPRDGDISLYDHQILPAYPTSRWHRGQYVVDCVLDNPVPGLRQDTYRVEVGVFDTERRLPVIPKSLNESVPLGWIELR